MKKFNQFLLSTVVLLGFMACSSNDNIGIEPTPPTPSEDKVSYISVNINSILNTRAETDGDSSTVFDGDNKINSITFYLIDGDGKVKEEIDLAELDKTDKHTAIIKATVKPGTYKLAALVNPAEGDKLKNPEPNSDDLATVRELENYRDLDTYKDDGKFLMFNANREGAGLTSIDLNYNTIDKPAQATIQVDRAFAAVKVGLSEGFKFGKNIVYDSDLGIEITDTYVMNVNNKFTYLQKWGKIDEHRFLDTPKGKYLNNLESVATFDTEGKVTGFTNNWNDFFISRDKYQLLTENNRSTWSDGEFTSPQGYTTAVIFRVTAGGKGLIAKKDGVNFVLYPYEDGVTTEEGTDVVFKEGMFYTYFIKDPNIKVSGKTYHAIVRNTAYDIKLNQIDRLGSTHPGGDIINPTDPDQPVDETKYTYIDVTVDVNKWIKGEIIIDK